ncbi:aldo/keto reductase [Phaeobacter gallaeciensis]|uniref:aldo/keto reductase n=1 Tax=Phaeobacter gallaeciensis TaxID=60890 RepID=UPI0023806958|nr:aldo/keto reductase [Phaeobacter gallaeciensis]MDE4276492.1 aldo/keto reductase [Phaeobacter gallaeciensis]MDE4301766.1 aldo/keto reductase [Phaeobacter gallaeciensis]MDE5186919.1 aldo/keto reductase [Phaeobacter gallaeciensis]
MKQRKLGAQGPEVGCIGYGAMSFSDMYGPTNEAESHAILDSCRDLGVTLLDSANIYGMGKSESAIGSYLSANPGARDEFVISTKATITRDADGNRCFDNSAEHLEAELDKSLQRLGVECVDLFYAHRRDPRFTPEETAANLGRLVEKGKTRAIGLSEVAPSTLRRAMTAFPVAAVQSEYSLSTRFPDLGLVQACAELGVAFVAFSPVGRSLLTDNPIPKARIPQLPFLAGNPRFMEPNLSENLRITDKFRALAAQMGTSAAALANAWLLTRGDHVIPIPGTRSVKHLEECVAGADLTLTPEDLERIETVLPVGWAHGDRYSDEQWIGPERYC